MKYYVLYRYDPALDRTGDFSDPAVEIEQTRPKLPRLALKGERLSVKGRVSRVLWILLSGGELTLYSVRDRGTGELLHRSAVMPGCYKFPFLKTGELHIGPCYTVEKARGRGQYPAVLHHIAANKPAPCYLIIHDANAASIAGAKKAGFVKYRPVQKAGMAWKWKEGQMNWLYNNRTITPDTYPHEEPQADSAAAGSWGRRPSFCIRFGTCSAAVTTGCCTT